MGEVQEHMQYFQVQPTRCNITQFIYFCEMLHIFQAVPPPIIRSSNCIYSIRYFVKPLLLPATVVEEMDAPAGFTKEINSHCTE